MDLRLRNSISTNTVVVIFFSLWLISYGHPSSSENQFRDKEHVKEHLREETGYEKPEEEMSDAELEFYFFRMHDYDNNTKLDGLEILAAMTHTASDPTERDDMTLSQQINERIKDWEMVIDRVLEDDDYNNDGYLEYLEYVIARRRYEE